MAYYDEQLQSLRERMAEKAHLEAVIRGKKEERRPLEAKVDELSRQMYREEADVTRLEGRSLAALYAKLTGRRDEKLRKERFEAEQARVRRDAALRELQAVNEDIEACEARLRSIESAEREYSRILKEKTAALRDAGGETGGQIAALEEEAVRLLSQKKEVGEAASAAGTALRCADTVLSRLDSAEGFGVWDMVGGGLIADVAKHSELDAAQEGVEALQVALRRLKGELADVQIREELQVNLDGFTRFADHFFDGLFMDWMVMDRISESKSCISGVRGRIDSTLRNLTQMERRIDGELRRNRSQLNTLVESTTL